MSQKFYQNTTPLTINNNNWYYSSSIITIPENTNIEKNMTIEVLNTSNLPITEIYSTDYKFFKVLSDDENYEITKDLKLLLLTQSVDTSSKKWSDYSGYHNNFYFTNTPTQIMMLILNNNKQLDQFVIKFLVINHQNFLLFLVYLIIIKLQYITKKENSKEYTEEELISGEAIKMKILMIIFLTVPGNQNYLLKVL